MMARCFASAVVLGVYLLVSGGCGRVAPGSTSAVVSAPSAPSGMQPVVSPATMRRFAVHPEERNEWIEVVQRCYPAWVGPSQTQLSRLRVDELLNNPEVRGSEAAALANIHHHFRVRDHWFTANHIKKRHGIIETFRSSQLPRTYKYYLGKLYQSNRDYLSQLPRRLFAEAEGPSLRGVAQGHVGDCYLLATLGSLVHHHPEVVRRMIREQDNGAFDIRLLDGREVRVPKVTDGMIVLGGRTARQGLWLHVLETAYGYHRLEQPQRKDPDRLPEDVLDVGNPGHVMTWLTGHPYHQFLIHPDDVFRTKVADDLRKLLVEGTRDRWLMTAHPMVRPGVKPPPEVIPFHLYAILGYEEKTDRVRLWNPHGAALNFQPRGPEGLQHGYLTRSGVFEVPLHDFLWMFNLVAYTQLPATAS